MATHFTVEKAHKVAQANAGACGNGAGDYTDENGWTYTVQLPTSVPADIVKAIAWLEEYGYGYPERMMATIAVRDEGGHYIGTLAGPGGRRRHGPNHECNECNA